MPPLYTLTPLPEPPTAPQPPIDIPAATLSLDALLCDHPPLPPPPPIDWAMIAEACMPLVDIPPVDKSSLLRTVTISVVPPSPPLPPIARATAPLPPTALEVEEPPLPPPPPIDWAIIPEEKSEEIVVPVWMEPFCVTATAFPAPPVPPDPPTAIAALNALLAEASKP